MPKIHKEENAAKITPTTTSFQIIPNSLLTSYFVIYASAFQIFLSEETLSRLKHFTETHPYVYSSWQFR